MIKIELWCNTDPQHPEYKVTIEEEFFICGKHKEELKKKLENIINEYRI